MVNGLAGGNHPVMTTLTGPIHLRMINRDHRQPRTADVATLTEICAVDMRGSLARSKTTVVARHTGLINHHGMIKRWHQPGAGHVAGATHLGSRNMVRRQTGGTDTVVTRLTAHIADDAVIHGGRNRKTYGIVANITGGAGRNMGGCLADGNDTVVTRFTTRG